MDIKHCRNTGTSLVETLVSMTLLGVIFIPLLFISSAVFLGQLVQMREQVDVSHSSSRFMGNFMSDLQRAYRVLPNSDSTNLYVAYVDPVRQTEVSHHYRIDGNRLRKFVLNQSSGNWQEVSPYGMLGADEITLSSGGTLQFGYCLDSDCSGNTDVGSQPERAVLVQLEDWRFTKGEQTQGFAKVDIMIGADQGSASRSIVADGESRESYSFSTSVQLGASADFRLLDLDPLGGGFNYLDFYGPAGTLTTILTDEQQPAHAGAFYPAATSAGEFYRPHHSTADGAVYFFENASPGSLWRWEETDGLSTIIDNQTYPGAESLAVAPDGRVFFGEHANPGSFWTWKGGVLSTLLDGGIKPGSYSGAVHSDGRVFFGEWDDWNSPLPQGFFTWKEGDGLSTLVSSQVTPGAENTVIAPDGRVIFGAWSGPPGWSWHPATGLSTITTTGSPGLYTTAATEDGRFYFGHWGSGYWTWKEGDGLSTIIPTTGSDFPGYSSTAVLPDGRVFVGETGDPFTAPHTGKSVWTWREDTGLSTIIASSASSPGYYSKTASDDRFFWGEYTTSGRYWTWKEGDGLSVILSGRYYPGYVANETSPVDGRVFFGDHSNPGNFYTWHEDTGLSTLVKDRGRPGFGTTAVDSSGRVYFGEYFSNGNFWTWHEDTGLTTVMDAVYVPYESVFINAEDQVFFGEWTDPGDFFTWSTEPATVAVHRMSRTGSQANSLLSVERMPVIYQAAALDIFGDLYLVNGDTQALERFTYQPSKRRHAFKSKLPLGAWAANVGAVVTDQANDDVALLDTVGKQIYVYGNRNATSGSPTVYDISGFATAPTGMAVNGRTGDYLVIDSNVYGAAGDEQVNLYLVDLNPGGPAASLVTTLPIGVGANYVASGHISNDLSGETDLRIQYDEARNILYLMAPAADKVYALMLPEYL